ncbi:MAG: hypothetical protein ACQET7_15165, partial [Thermodesulfobacteriota bacterium]
MPISASICEVDKKSSFLNWKLASAQKAFLDGHYVNSETKSHDRVPAEIGVTIQPIPIRKSMRGLTVRISPTRPTPTTAPTMA